MAENHSETLEPVVDRAFRNALSLLGKVCAIAETFGIDPAVLFERYGRDESANADWFRRIFAGTGYRGE